MSTESKAAAEVAEKIIDFMHFTRTNHDLYMAIQNSDLGSTNPLAVPAFRQEIERGVETVGQMIGHYGLGLVTYIDGSGQERQAAFRGIGVTGDSSPAFDWHISVAQIDNPRSVTRLGTDAVIGFKTND